MKSLTSIVIMAETPKTVEVQNTKWRRDKNKLSQTKANHNEQVWQRFAIFQAWRQPVLITVAIYHPPAASCQALKQDIRRHSRPKAKPSGALAGVGDEGLGGGLGGNGVVG